MRIRNSKWILFMSIAFFACTKSPSPESFMDFTSSNFFLPSDIRKTKTNVKCDEDAYWEGKTIKLKGFVFSGNIDTADRHFFIFETNDIRDDISLNIYYKCPDSKLITDLLLSNQNKACQLTVTCSSGTAYVAGCTKAVHFNLQKIGDIKF
jgi:hypothetical protein